MVIAGRYRLLREVGRGGMGAVWLAHDTVLDRQVALKRVGLMPGSEVADLERVRRESRVSAMLSHPHVVAVFDLVDEDDRHWLVMEYVEGDSLAALVRRHRSLSPDRTAVIVAQAARGLAAAHEAGITHRDVKPSNILVRPDGVAKLGDFGIARTSADPTLTQTGMVTGSPGYLAPEVAAGRPATPASDLWSLGATVFHAVTGRPPYDTSENLMGALYRLVNEEPPRTDRAAWLAPLLEATMHRDPAGRWDAGQVVAFLAGGPQGAPMAPTRVSPASAPAAAAPAGSETTQVLPRQRPARGRWWLVGGAAAVLLAVVVALVLLLGPSDDPPGGTAGDPSPTSSSPGTESPAPPTAPGMTQFVEDYLSEVTQDPRSTWDRLTPSFQDASGGFDSYSDFWTRVESAEPSDIRADPSNLTVRYEVEYEMRSGDETEDDVTLVLTWDGERYLIDREP
jgi:serine/threonine protein kinase